MIDIEQTLRDDAEQWQWAVDSGARPARERRSDRRHRPLVLVASAIVVLAAILGTTLSVVSHQDSNSPSPQKSGQRTRPPSGRAALRGFTWTDPHFSSGTVVFGDKTVNVSNGCFSGLQALRVDGHFLTIGGRVGQQSVCGEVIGPPRPGQRAFDRVVQGGTLEWSIAGRTLTLTPASGRSLGLVRSSTPAPAITAAVGVEPGAGSQP